MEVAGSQFAGLKKSDSITRVKIANVILCHSLQNKDCIFNTDCETISHKRFLYQTFLLKSNRDFCRNWISSIITFSAS